VLSRLAVVVPAHNEEDLLPGCLSAVAVAAEAVDLPVRVIVVLDSCTDGTGAVARAAGVATVPVAARSVGVARATGAGAALADGADGLWMAHTDADSRVPPDWLLRQLAHARAGAEVIAGTVRVDDWSGWPHPLPARYERRYHTGHRHVHGANLAMSATAYRAAGGFPARPAHEDRLFVAAAVRAGRRVVYPIDLPVRTSARRGARVAGGFAGYLAGLAAQL
jgi:glycosyltransferase involved in cell wall biosynthesis